ncbi:MAG: hypothetical protein IPH13_10140 [Planctomycetes bacterium]|nr:hypothetical protein [Planctomycetota bacterium]
MVAPIVNMGIVGGFGSVRRLVLLGVRIVWRVGIKFAFVGVLSFFVVALARVLHLLEQVGEVLVVHSFEARQRERGLIADREEDDGVTAGSGLQFEVEQAFVQDPDVLARQVREVDWRGDPRTGASLADLHARARDALEELTDGGVRNRRQLRVEAGGLEDTQGASQIVTSFRVSQREQLAAVGRNRQARMVRSSGHQVEERQDARPCVIRTRKSVSASRGNGLQLVEESTEAVRTVIDRVVARQQFARLGEQHDHHAHDDAARGAVNLGGFNVGAAFVQRVAVRLDEKLDGFADALAKDGREFRLPFAAVEDRLEQGRRRVLAGVSPERGSEQGAQRGQLRR